LQTCPDMTEVSVSPLLLLVAYGVLILVASLAGGWLPLLMRPTHTRLQLATSFVAGMMLGIGLLHMLPHAWHQVRSIDRVAAWLVAGFLVVFLIQRFLHFHHHDVPEKVSETECACQHSRDHGHDHEHQTSESDCSHSLADQSAQRLSWAGASLGLCLHSILDGVAVAASVQAESHGHAAGLLTGMGTFLVVFLHKPFDAMAIGVLMTRGANSLGLRHLINGVLALAVPVGMLLFYLGFSRTGSAEAYLGAALAFSGGTFLCIAASDLLPELQFHAHDRWKLSFALLAGLALSVAIGAFEQTGHDHSPGVKPAAPEAAHEH
jgi:zinc and cadmium transporter